jgi:palmitoyltransferase
VLPLLRNDYTYDQSINNIDDNAPGLLVAMKRVSGYAKIFVESFQDNGNNGNEFVKGLIYCIFINFFVLWFMVGFMRTVFTNPGRVQKDWNDAQKDKEARQKNEAKQKARERINEEVKVKEALKAVKVEGEVHQNLAKKALKRQDIERLDVSNSPRVSGNEQVALNVSGNEDAQPLLKDGEVSADLPKADKETPADETSSVNSKRLQEAIQKQEDQIYREMMSMNKVRQCSHCNHFKPQRAHHCRQCNACTLKMDHHCPWVNNCVGYRNYKYFMIMLIYAVLCLWFVVFTYTEVVGDTILNENIVTTLLFTIVLMYMLALTMAIIVTAFTIFHFWLITKGKTTLEYCEKANSGSYGKSTWANLKETFGTNILLWPFPFAPNYESEGTDFFKREDKE